MRMRTFLTVVVAAAALGVAPLTACAGAFQEGLAAYEAGDYAKALELLRPLADQGGARGQSKRGVMYLTGWGMTRDDAEGGSPAGAFRRMGSLQ